MSGACVAAFTTMFVASVFAHDKTNFETRLVGYEETPLTINSTGSGEFSAKISKDGTSIQYQLTYRDLPTSITQSHIHFGRQALSGGIVLFLCTNLGNAPASVPTPQLCPTASPTTITGTLTAADVIAIAGQSIDPGTDGFAEIVRAIRAGAAYVNVHTTGHGGGEIRGALGRNDGSDDDDD